MNLTIIAIFLTSLSYAQNRIRVSGVSNTSKYEKIVVSCLDQLGIESTVYLTIVMSKNMPYGYQGITIPVNSSYPGVPIFRIMIDKFVSSKQQQLILAHEMIHVKQYMNEELVVIDEKTISWNGNEYHYHPMNNRKMPWETEAYAFDQELVRLISTREAVPSESEVLVFGELETGAFEVDTDDKFMHVLSPVVVTLRTSP